MNWRNPKNELPIENSTIFYIIQHWKKHKYLSCEILSGEVIHSSNNTSCIVENWDYTGRGSQMASLKGGD